MSNRFEQTPMPEENEYKEGKEGIGKRQFRDLKDGQKKIDLVKERIKCGKEAVERFDVSERAEYKEGECSRCGTKVRSGKFCAKCGATFLIEQQLKDIKKLKF